MPATEDSLGNAIVDACADILCGASVKQISEVGTFYDRPSVAARDVASAIRASGEALGVASWALTPLYKAAKARIAISRSDFRAASAILVATPDFRTAWAVRREHLCRLVQDVHSLVEAELHFCGLMLRRSPKSVEAWSHRGWILDRFGWGNSAAVREELRIARLAASSSACNYYAGVHRCRALAFATPEMMKEAIRDSREWLMRNVSDSSGWWFHSIAVERLIASPEGYLFLAESESIFADEMAKHYGKEYASVRKYYTRWSKISEERKSLAAH